jgi:hypothetical protein
MDGTSRYVQTRPRCGPRVSSGHRRSAPHSGGPDLALIRRDDAGSDIGRVRLRGYAALARQTSHDGLPRRPPSSRQTARDYGATAPQRSEGGKLARPDRRAKSGLRSAFGLRRDSLRLACRAVRLRGFAASARQTSHVGLPRRSSLGLAGRAKSGAEEGTRTPTILLPPAPQAGASANSATSAWVVRPGW